MSAERLRRVAAEMREFAEAATPGPWSHAGYGEVVAGYADPDHDDQLSAYYCDANVARADDYDGDEKAESDARHIAAWSPPVALAVADWLDSAASAYVEDEPIIDAALAVCDAWEAKP